LNDFCCFQSLPGFGAVSVDAVAGDCESAVKVIQLLALQPDCLLATPSKAVRPRRITQHDLVASIAGLDCNLDFTVFTRGLWRLNCRAMTAIHLLTPRGMSQGFGLNSPGVAKLKTNFN
jgi:hypothetical protein